MFNQTRLQDDKVFTLKLIDGQEFIKVDDVPINSYYRVFESQPVGQYRTFFCHIIFEDIWKVSTHNYFYHIQELGIKTIKENFKNTNINNASGYTIFELKNGLKFVPDIKMFNYGLNFKELNEKKYNIKLGGVVMVIDPNKQKFHKFLHELIKLYGRFTNFDSTTSASEAFESIKKFKI